MNKKLVVAAALVFGAAGLILAQGTLKAQPAANATVNSATNGDNAAVNADNAAVNADNATVNADNATVNVAVPPAPAVNAAK